LKFATKEIYDALRSRDIGRAIVVLGFGRDSWNSSSTIVNKAIVPKIGDKFAMIV